MFGPIELMSIKIGSKKLQFITSVDGIDRHELQIL